MPNMPLGGWLSRRNHDLDACSLCTGLVHYSNTRYEHTHIHIHYRLYPYMCVVMPTTTTSNSRSVRSVDSAFGKGHKPKHSHVCRAIARLSTARFCMSQCAIRIIRIIWCTNTNTYTASGKAARFVLRIHTAWRCKVQSRSDGGSFYSVVAVAYLLAHSLAFELGYSGEPELCEVGLTRLGWIIHE